MFTSPGELTRRQRARRYFAALVLPAVVLLFLIWGPRQYANSDGYRYEAVTAWGAFSYFEMSHAGAVGTGGMPVPQTRGERFIWPGVPKCVAVTLILEGILIGLHRSAVAAGKLKGRCDECGYDLRGITSSRCPECGHPFAPSDSKPLKGPPTTEDGRVPLSDAWEGQRRRLLWTSDQRGR